jgi:hypothetical protein
MRLLAAPAPQHCLQVLIAYHVPPAATTTRFSSGGGKAATIVNALLKFRNAQRREELFVCGGWGLDSAQIYIMT